ncbi:MAG TPA: Uma2 family endonuclease [Gemmataceae bacterium]|nr:Uma2 family endonuclease [Gemmataceae bacterium]
MATVTEKCLRQFGPDAAGTLMTPREFDRADFVEGWRYELIRGVLIVTPIPLEKERDPNEELGHLLREYRDRHPQGGTLDATLFEHTVRTGPNRRRADRVIWAGLGRYPRRGETPTIIAEFVSAGKRDRTRDYEEKRDEYQAVGVQEYWVIDRFNRTMTVYVRHGSKFRRRVLKEDQIYTTTLLPGFELPLARLFALADRWPEEAE